MFHLTANGQVRSGYVYNWTSWLDDYGFGKCTDVKRCNVFPDGKPFPQSNDWSRKSYVYVWHAMGEKHRFRFANMHKNNTTNSFTLFQASTTRLVTAPPLV